MGLEAPIEAKGQYPRKNGCFGWVFVWIGVALLFHENWGLAWAGLAISIGLVYLIRAFRDPGEESAILPAVILLVTGSTVLAQIQGWTDFEMWKIWPIFLGSVGMGLVLLWALKDGGVLKLVVGGALLIGFSYGLASSSWYRYLRDLRRFLDYWPLLIGLLGLLILIDRWRRRSESKNS